MIPVSAAVITLTYIQTVGDAGLASVNQLEIINVDLVSWQLGLGSAMKQDALLNTNIQ